MPRPEVTIDTRRQLYRLVREHTDVEAHESPAFEEALEKLLNHVESEAEVQQIGETNAVETVGDFGSNRNKFR